MEISEVMTQKICWVNSLHSTMITMTYDSKCSTSILSCAYFYVLISDYWDRVMLVQNDIHITKMSHRNHVGFTSVENIGQVEQECWREV